MIMCVPNIFDRVGLEDKVIWHLKDIEKSLIKKGTISSELIGIPLPEIKISWQQNKQGKGKSKAEKDLSLNDLVGFQQNGCMVCTVQAAKKTGSACRYCGRNSTRWFCVAGFLDKIP
jgi:hypothetical protein